MIMITITSYSLLKIYTCCTINMHINHNRLRIIIVKLINKKRVNKIFKN